MKNISHRLIQSIKQFKDIFINIMLALLRFIPSKLKKKFMNKLKKNNFNKSKKSGKKAEATFKKYVRDYSNYTLKEDVSENKDYWEKDIDEIVLTPKGKEKTVEVKKMEKDILKIEDTVIFKDSNGEVHKKLGNIWYSQADYFAFVDSIKEKIFIINLKTLRRYYWENHQKYKSLQEYHYIDSEVKTNQLKFIPLADIIELGYFFDMGDEWS